MAGAGWKSYSTGDLIDATTFQTFIQDQVIQVYATVSARDTALGTNDAEGMFCFLKDNSAGSDGSGTSELQFYNGSAWVAFVGDGDITGVTITTASNSGLAGGSSATSGAFSATMTTDLNNLASATVSVANDSIAIIDADDSNGSKKESIADFVSGIAGTGLTASSGQLNASAGVSLGLVLALS
ncbi:component of the counting factor complex [uncultured Mediterranean phage uvMED]|jgi:hypothetical protein|nr:component of the counting factor complex [uncultured Mediterranean phage uvMED]BAR14791.1 component of the counting factor complex [uncultured Mediterranean phage uvMED]